MKRIVFAITWRMSHQNVNYPTVRGRASQILDARAMEGRARQAALTGTTSRYTLSIRRSILPSSAKKADLLKAAKGHMLAEGQLMGKYRRR